MRLPTDSERQVTIGRTGSGKTMSAAYTLSLRAGRTIPWVILNFKEDELLNAIPGEHLQSMMLPKNMQRTVYIAHPEPDDFDTLQGFLQQIWSRRNVGVFVDEAYMMAPSPQSPNPWFRRLLIQGRSLNTPLIVCTQQPSQIDSHVFTESEFFNVFQLQGRNNARVVEQKLDREIDLKVLPRYYSYWYDHIEGVLEALRPVPQKEVILARFGMTLERAEAPPEKRWFV